MGAVAQINMNKGNVKRGRRDRQRWKTGRSMSSEACKMKVQQNLQVVVAVGHVVELPLPARRPLAPVLSFVSPSTILLL
jgi:hypothetical protein